MLYNEFRLKKEDGLFHKGDAESPETAGGSTVGKTISKEDINMKKRKVLGAIAGVVAIAIAAGATYAWFVSTPEAQTVQITAAKIEVGLNETIAVNTSISDIALPGELVTEDDQSIKITNDSTRPAVLCLSGGKFDPKQSFLKVSDEARKAKLIKLCNDNIKISFGLTQDEIDAGDILFTETTNGYYFYLPVGMVPECFNQDFAFTVPGQLGGNYFQSGSEDDDKLDYQNEHKAEMVYTLNVKAVQASKVAIGDIFPDDATDIIAAFGIEGDGNDGVLYDF